MADGVEIRGNRVRVYFRYESELCREPMQGDASPERLANAERLVGTINYEIKEGIFSYVRHFPESPRVKTNTLGHYIDLWLDIKRNELAPSGFRTYKSKAETHIRPVWGDMQADQIDHLDLQAWVQKVLMPKLHNKTVKRQKVRFVFHKTTTDAAWTSSDVLLKTWWRKHLADTGVRYRGPNNCRHTYASQMLSTGVVPLDWITDQMGHTSTAMIWRHYGTWINEDGPDMIGLLEHALKL